MEDGIRMRGNLGDIRFEIEEVIENAPHRPWHEDAKMPPVFRLSFFVQPEHLLYGKTWADWEIKTQGLRSRKKKEPIGRETNTVVVKNDSLRATKHIKEWELYYDFDDMDDALYSLYKYGMKMKELKDVI